MLRHWRVTDPVSRVPPKEGENVSHQQWTRNKVKKIGVDLVLQSYWSVCSVRTLTVTSTAQLGTVSASRYPSFSPEASETSSLNRVLPVPLLSVKINGVCSGTLKKPFPVIIRCLKKSSSNVDITGSLSFNFSCHLMVNWQPKFKCT